MTSDDVLKTALIQTAEEFFSRYMPAAGEKPHRFSLAFYIRKISVERLARRAVRVPAETISVPKYIPLKRLAVLIAVLLSAAFLTAGAWVAYISVRGFVFEVHTTYSDVSVDFSMYDIKETIDEAYGLPIENGYELVYEITDSQIIISEYKYKDKKLTLVQYAGEFAETSMLNTENSEVSEITINNNAGFILVNTLDSTENGITITWIQDGYLFDIIGTSFEKEEVIEIAKSVAVLEKNNS
ncbi:MAG: DUF4367 domain-containing protein [Bacteroides sp.]|nr:DUF4367 domain-containing protein [Bacteroides sp.]